MADIIETNESGYVIMCNICEAKVRYYSKDIHAITIRHGNDMNTWDERYINCPCCHNQIDIGAVPTGALYDDDLCEEKKGIRGALSTIFKLFFGYY